MHYETPRTEGRPASTASSSVAGEGEESKAVVSGLIEEIGFDPVDTGSSKGGKQQPGSPVYDNPMAAERARRLLA